MAKPEETIKAEKAKQLAAARSQQIARRRFRSGQARRAAVVTHACGRVVLTGLDADDVAMTAVVDPEPLDVLGECVALLTGRMTYDRADEGDGRPILWMRYPHHISEPRRWPVLAEHRCVFRGG